MNHTPQQREAHLKIVMKRRRDAERARVLAEAASFAESATAELVAMQFEAELAS